MPRPPAKLHALALVVTLTATAALAGRSLDEPDAVKAIPRMVPAAKVASALAAAKLAEKCSPQVMKAPELVGMSCRLAVHRALAREHTVDTLATVTRRIAAGREAAAAAKGIAGYAPLSKKPGFERELFDAQREACATVVETYDALKAAPPTVPADARSAIDGALAGDGNLFDAACGCVQDGVSLADAAGASIDERGTLQGMLTSRGCFLDREKIKAERGGPEASFTGEATKLAAKNTDEARLLDYANARLVGIGRCTEKGIVAGRIVEKKKLESCVCAEIGRFAFPKEKGRADVKIVVPIAEDRLGVEVVVNAPGKVTSCGPLVGSMLK